MMAAWADDVEAIGADHDAGSWALTRRAAVVLARAASEGDVALESAVRGLIEAQPAMAALRNLANAAAWAAHDGRNPVAVALFFVLAGDNEIAAISRRTVLLLASCRRVVTISAGASVEAALRARAGSVLVLESRPRTEGAALAGRLAAAGLPVTLAVDAAGRALLRSGDVVLLGADSVTPAGVTNKVGSWLLAAGAAELRLPCFVLAGEEKWWPTPLPLPPDDRSPEEVAPNRPSGVAIANPAFETVPFHLVTAVVTGDGARQAADVIAALAGWRVHPWLREGE